MASGYTWKLYEGRDISFSEFVMNCARAIGYLVSMKDEPPDAPIPEKFQPSRYSLDALNKAKQAIDKARKLSIANAARKAEREYRKELRERQREFARTEAARKRYESMLTKVKRWVPPTLKHLGLKDFMITQLINGINHDCGSRTLVFPRKISGAEYKSRLIKEAKRNIRYYSQEQKADTKSAEECTAWVKALRDSLQ